MDKKLIRIARLLAVSGMSVGFITACNENSNMPIVSPYTFESDGIKLNQVRPVLNDSNLATYVAVLVKDIDALKDFHQDLSTDFVGTLEARFTIDSLTRLKVLADAPNHTIKVEFFGELINLLEEYPELQSPSKRWNVYSNILSGDTLHIDEPEEDEGNIVMQRSTTTATTTTGTWSQEVTTTIKAETKIKKDGNEHTIGIERKNQTKREGTGEPPGCCL